MEITLEPDLEFAIRELARRDGRTPEALAIDILRQRLLTPINGITPRDDWERQLLSAATDCGVSLPPAALTSDGMYE